MEVSHMWSCGLPSIKLLRCFPVAKLSTISKASALRSRPSPAGTGTGGGLVQTRSAHHIFTPHSAPLQIYYFNSSMSGVAGDLTCSPNPSFSPRQIHDLSASAYATHPTQTPKGSPSLCQKAGGPALTPSRQGQGGHLPRLTPSRDIRA